MTKQDIRSFERTRAANIVSLWENELREKLSAKPDAKNALQVATIISRLENIKSQIMGSMQTYKMPIKRDPDGSFSLEEIEAAMEFVNTPEANPFEGE